MKVMEVRPWMTAPPAEERATESGTGITLDQGEVMYSAVEPDFHYGGRNVSIHYTDCRPMGGHTVAIFCPTEKLRFLNSEWLSVASSVGSLKIVPETSFPLTAGNLAVG
jgi:hypothetical protein